MGRKRGGIETGVDFETGFPLEGNHLGGGLTLSPANVSRIQAQERKQEQDQRESLQRELDSLQAEVKALADKEREANEVTKKATGLRAKIAASERALHEMFIIQNIDALLALKPTHGRTGCSDADPSNYGRARCARCALLHIKDTGNVSNVTVTVDVMGWDY